MMASNIATAEEGGDPGPQPLDDDWWTRYASWLATIGAVASGFLSSMGILFNIISLGITSLPVCILQVCAACVILSIEGSSVVSFLTVAKPIGKFFEGRPLFVKVGVYALLSIIPVLVGPFGLLTTLSFLISFAITLLYGRILIGKKGSLSEMAANAQQPKI